MGWFKKPEHTQKLLGCSNISRDLHLPLQKHFVLPPVSKASSPHPQVLHQPQILHLVLDQMLIKLPCGGERNRQNRKSPRSTFNGTPCPLLHKGNVSCHHFAANCYGQAKHDHSRGPSTDLLPVASVCLTDFYGSCYPLNWALHNFKGLYVHNTPLRQATLRCKEKEKKGWNIFKTSQVAPSKVTLDNIFKAREQAA